MGQLDGKIGIITGAASGIGAACARVLSREGAKLVLTDLDDAAGPAPRGADRRRLSAPRRHRRSRLARGGRRGGAASAGCTSWSPMPASASWVGDRHVVGRLAAADGGERRWRVPDGEARHPADAPFRWRFDRDDVVGRRDARFGKPGGLQRDQGRGAAVRQVDRAGVRAGARQHPGELGASRRHRHADLDQAAAGRERTARSEQDRRGDGADRQGRPGGGHRQRRAVPVLRRVEPHDRIGTGDRWRDDRGTGRT